MHSLYLDRKPRLLFHKCVSTEDGRRIYVEYDDNELKSAR